MHQLTVDSYVKDMVKESIINLVDYCEKNNWAGYDPYDGLNSRLFKKIPFLQNKICRLIFIQAMKRSPINFRPMFLVPKSQNPKGLALFSSALLKLSKFGLVDNQYVAISLLNRLIDLRSPNRPYYCWGYNFDWQSRRFFLPKFEPNIICTTFAGNAFLDAYDIYGEDSYFKIARSAGQFVLKGLNISENSNGICFSYTPFDRGQVHNANLLGAAFLSRLYSISNDRELFDYALLAVRFSASKQDDNGSWPYGESHTQKWIDNFHTGYNLVALSKFCQYTGNTDFIENIKKGFDFFLKHFFTRDGLAKYYHNRTYPIDIHSIAQSIITLIKIDGKHEKNINLISSLLHWAVEYMQKNEGYFYYQQRRYIKNKISYMRWSQAWMLYAISVLTEAVY